MAASTTIGMLIGALISGPIADRIGRKKTSIVLSLLAAISNILVLVSPANFTLIFTLRVMVGVGVGGFLPILAALVSELSKPEERGKNICFLESFWAYGWLVALIITWIIISRANWQLAMTTTGIVALILTILAYPLIPKSPRYLVLIGRRSEAERIAHSYGLKVPELKSMKPNLHEQISILLSPENRIVTIALWVVWFTIAMGYYGIFIWLPKSVLATKIPLVKSFKYLAVMTLAQIPGYYSAVLLVEKIGRKPILSTYLALTGLSSFMYARAANINEMMLWGSILSFFDLGSWAALYTFTPEQYPTYTRGIGSSWASAMGRIGAILGPYIVPILISMGEWFLAFTFFAVVHMVGAASALLGRELKGKEMPEIAG